MLARLREVQKFLKELECEGARTEGVDPASTKTMDAIACLGRVLLMLKATKA